jgi:hypothetical protein
MSIKDNSYYWYKFEQKMPSILLVSMSSSEKDLISFLIAIKTPPPRDCLSER